MFADVNFYFLAVKKCTDVDQETTTTVFMTRRVCDLLWNRPVGTRSRRAADQCEEASVVAGSDVMVGGVTGKLQVATLVLRRRRMTVECNENPLMCSVVYSNGVYRALDS